MYSCRHAIFSSFKGSECLIRFENRIKFLFTKYTNVGISAQHLTVKDKLKNRNIKLNLSL